MGERPRDRETGEGAASLVGDERRLAERGRTLQEQEGRDRQHAAGCEDHDMPADDSDEAAAVGD